MKKIALIIVFLISLFVFSNIGTRLYADDGYKPIKNVIKYTEIIKIEYILSDDQWYEITYYVDGSIGVVQVTRPPDM